MKTRGFKSLTVKMLAIYLSLVAVSALLLFSVLEVRTFMADREKLATNLQSIADIQSRPIETALWELNAEEVRKIVGDIGALAQVEAVQVLDTYGKMVSRAGVENAQPAKPEYQTARNLTFKNEFFEEPVGTLQITVHDREIYDALMQRLTVDVTVLAIMIIVLGIGTVTTTNRLIGRPLSRLLHSIDKFKRENLREAVQWESADELGQVVQAYNQMQAAQAEAEAEIKQHQETLENRIAERTAELAEKEAYLRLALDNMQSGMRLIDKDRNYVLFNQQYLDLYDYPDGLLKVGETIRVENLYSAQRGDFGPGDPDALTDQSMAELQARGETAGWERTITGGKTLRVHAAPTPEGGYVSIASDITAEVESQRAAKLLQEALDNFSDMVILYDKDEKVIFTNDRYHEIYPMAPSKDEITDHTMESLLRRSLDAGLISNPLAISDPEAWLQERLEERRSNEEGTGESVHASGRSYLYRFRRTTEGGLIFAQTDITESKLAEQALASKEALLRAVLDNIPVGIRMTDKNRNYVYFNALYSEMYEFPEGLLKVGESMRVENLFQAKRGDFGPGDPETLVDDWMSVDIELTENASWETTIACNDEKKIQIITTPTPDGGVINIATDITERKKASAALEREKQIVDLVLENMDQGISMFDGDLNITAFNDKFVQLLDLSTLQIEEGMSLESIFRFNAERGEYGPGDIDEQVRERIESEKKFEANVFERARPDGTVIEIRGNPVESGGFVSTYTDITERKRAEERFRGLIEAAPEAMVITGADGIIQLINAQAENLFGYKREELEGELVEILIPKKLRVSHVDRRKEYSVAPGRRYMGPEMNIYGRRKDGEKFPVDITLSPLETDEGVLITSTIRDITERKRAEEELAQALREFGAVMDAIDYGIVFMDSDLRARIINRAFQNMWELTDEDIAELPTMTDLIQINHRRGFYDVPDDEFDNYLAERIAAVREGDIPPTEIARADGKHYIYQCTALPDGGRMLTYYDITDRKHGEEALREARDTAEAATRAKAEFLASMSHEIRTPMNGVVGMADLLSQTTLDEDQRQMLDTVRDSGNALITIINDILDFSKIEAGKLDIEKIPMSLSDVLEGACATLAPTARGKGVRLITFVDPAIPLSILGDPVRIRQVIFNLAGNAVKFADQGQVIVRADLFKKKRIRLSVIDDGIGMSEEAQGRLFKAFMQAEQSTTRKYGGTGLGLAICKRITELMDGEIGVTSVLGEGSTFTMEFPFDHTDEVRSHEKERDLSGLRILVVTDNEMLQEAMERYLTHWQADVVSAADEEEAEAALKAEDIDTVVLDLSLDQERQKVAMSRLERDELKFILLNEGGRRGARIEGSNSVSLDANPLGRARLITAVAVAAGRASPEVRPADENMILSDKKTPTIGEALARGELILLAEDNLTNRQVIGRQLNKLGYACEFAEDGKLALAAWKEKNYALLLTDCHMPNMDGYELAAAIRDDEREGDTRAPIIAVTANALQGEAERCIAAGMDDYLSKPVAMKELLAKLQKWMPDASAASVSVAEQRAPEKPDKVTETAGVLDPSFLRETFGDDNDLIREILQDYVQPAGDCIGEIVEAYDAHDGAALGQAAHKLKSSSRSVGADGLADLCQSLEQAGKAEDWESVENTYPQLAPTLEAVIAAIKNF